MKSTSGAPGSGGQSDSAPDLGYDASAPDAPVLPHSSELVKLRSRKRTHAIPLTRVFGAEQAAHPRSVDLPRRMSRARRSKPSRLMRARVAQSRRLRAAHSETEEAPESRPGGVALTAPRERTRFPSAPTVIAGRRGGVAIITMRLARALGRGKTPAGETPRKRPWVWVALNMLAILLVAQACILSEVDSSAISKAVNPLIAAFTGAQPETYDMVGPTPHPVDTSAAFIATMLPYARHASKTLGWPVSMILAQWGVEHGWTLPDFDGWNVGNTKAFNSSAGVCYGASVVRGFCSPKTPGAGLAIYLHGAQLHYYSGVAVAARQGGPNAAARALGASPWDAGHYTTDNSPGDTLLRAMQALNLYRYDTP